MVIFYVVRVVRLVSVLVVQGLIEYICSQLPEFFGGLCRNLENAKMQEGMKSGISVCRLSKLGLENAQNELYILCLSLPNHVVNWFSSKMPHLLFC